MADEKYLRITPLSYTVPSDGGTVGIYIESNVEWTVSTNADSLDITSGSGNAMVTLTCEEWFSYSDRNIVVVADSELGSENAFILQEHTVPWVVMDSPTKTVPASGGRLTINDFYSNTNCDYVSLSTSVGTITPTEHTGKWGETTSIDYVLDIPATVDARTIVVTGSSKTSDGLPINSELKIQQAGTHTFEITTTIVAIDTGGGTVTKKYKTSAPSIQLELTGLPSCVSDFSYTQPVDGVGTFSVTYDSNYLKQGRYVRFYVVASYEGTQIAKIRESDWQGGTAFWMPDTAESISSQAQVRSYIVHNVTYDVKEKNIYVHPLVPGLTMESYVPSTQDSTGLLYLNIPANTGAERTFRITVDVLDDNGAIIDTETGVTVTQAGRPKVVDVELNVDAAFHKEDVEIDLYGEWWVSSKANWLSSDTSDGENQSTIAIRIRGNSTQSVRYGYVYVYGETQTMRIKVVQDRVDLSINPSNNAIPICKPIVYQEESDKVEYRVVDQEVPGPIYTGCAYKYPDGDNVTIELNEVLSNQLRNHISYTEGEYEMDGYFKKFGVQNIATGKGAIIYSYNAWEEPKWVLLNDPISNIIDPRQYLFINYLDAYNDCILYKNGEPICEYGKKGGIVVVAPRADATCGEEVWYDVKLSNGNILAVQGYAYRETNKNYALYYINAYGGWDSLAIRGNTMQTDNIQSQTYKNKTNGKVKYLNTITPTWQLYTDDMNDGSKMHHLLESTEVYLHNLETDEIVPVVITDTSCVYKTFANQGNTRFHYTINVEASNYKIRK